MQFNGQPLQKVIVNTKKYTCASNTKIKRAKFVKEKLLLVNKDVGLREAEIITETRDSLSIPVLYVIQKKNSWKISRQMPKMCN